MSHGLSPQSEEYLASVVAGGVYPSPEAALEAAIVALREKNEQIPYVPDEHMEQVEQGIISANAGRYGPMTEDDWSRLDQVARDAAAKKGDGDA